MAVPPSPRTEELMLPSDLWKPKSNCWTVKSKFPRTINNQTYKDWAKSEVHDGKNFYIHPLPPCEPGPPWTRFRPLPPIPHEEIDRQRRTEIINSRRGLKTPEPFLHFGYKHFCFDHTQKKRIRHYNDPIPYTLTTEFRVAYQSPQVKSHLILEQNYKKFGLKPRNFALGITPCTLSIPPIFPSGDPTVWEVGHTDHRDP